PYDGVVDWLACFPVPNDSRLSLIGDTNARYIFRIDFGVGDAILDALNLRGHDFAGVMLYPARLGKNLSEFLLPDSNHLAVLVKQDRTATSGSLIQTQYESRH